MILEDLKRGNNFPAQGKILFESYSHLRYENGRQTKPEPTICDRAIEIESKHCNGSEGYLVTIHNVDARNSYHVTMAPKPMKVIEVTNEKIVLRGFGIYDAEGMLGGPIPYANYGLTIFLKNGIVDKVILHMYDKDSMDETLKIIKINVDIEYYGSALVNSHKNHHDKPQDMLNTMKFDQISMKLSKASLSNITIFQPTSYDIRKSEEDGYMRVQHQVENATDLIQIEIIPIDIELLSPYQKQNKIFPCEVCFYHKDKNLSTEVCDRVYFDATFAYLDRLRLATIPNKSNLTILDNIEIESTRIVENDYVFGDNEPFACDMFLSNSKTVVISLKFAGSEKMIFFYLDEDTKHAFWNRPKKVIGKGNVASHLLKSDFE